MPYDDRQLPPHPMSMFPSRITILIIAFLVALEAGVALWRHNVPVSTAPVFYWKEEPLLTTAPPPFGDALNLYRANRGAEQTKELPEGRKMTVFYFEWDRVDAGPLMNIGEHLPEVCNTAAGFILESREPNRVFEASGHSPLVFDTTTFPIQPGATSMFSKPLGSKGWAPGTSVKVITASPASSNPSAADAVPHASSNAESPALKIKTKPGRSSKIKSSNGLYGSMTDDTPS